MNRLLKNMVYHTPRLFSDRTYLELYFELHMGYRPDLDNPVTFNEKIQWLKLHDRRAEYASMTDKCEAKKFAARVIGQEHIIPTLAVYDSADDIDWNSLPRQFVLKCTHDSGGLVLCRDKTSLDIRQARRKLSAALKNDFWYRQREWAYRNVRPRIISEPLMGGSEGLADYKFFCFGGKPEFMYISEGMDDHGTARMSFTDMQGRKLPFSRSDYASYDGEIPIPGNLSTMTEMAGELARAVNNSFIRVDLYNVDGHIYFSELTFYPNGGLLPFRPAEWDRKLGDLIVL